MREKMAASKSFSPVYSFLPSFLLSAFSYYKNHTPPLELFPQTSSLISILRLSPLSLSSARSRFLALSLSIAMDSSFSLTPTSGEDELAAYTTRTQKKRAATLVSEVAGEPDSSPSNKKRAVLGDITNSPAADSTGSNFVSTREPKPELKVKGKIKGISKKVCEENVKINAGSGLDEYEQKFCGVSSIYQYLHSLEVDKKRQPVHNYMETIQKDITANMREILVDWLVEVAEEYKLVSDTLYFTVSYIDRFLSSHSIFRNKLQLLGVACMHIASKSEEISPPHVEDFCYITDNTYTKDEVVNMEKAVLKFLYDETGAPTTKTFLRIFTRTAQESSKLIADLKLEFLGCYLAELSLLDYACVGFLPSVVAASAIFLARFTLRPKRHPWNLALQQCSGYCPSELKECVTVLHELQLGKRRVASSAVTQKYIQPKLKNVASLNSPAVIPTRFFEIASR